MSDLLRAQSDAEPDVVASGPTALRAVTVVDPPDVADPERVGAGAGRRLRAQGAALEVAVVLLAVLAVGVLGDGRWGLSAAPPPGADHGGRVVQEEDACLGAAAAGCVAPATGVQRFYPEVPFTVEVPDGWAFGGGPVDRSVEIRSPRHTGVSVVFGPVAARPVSGRRPDRSVGDAAASLSSWLVGRPYLRPTEVRRTQVSGLPAYAVDVRLRAGAPATHDCSWSVRDCVPMLVLPYSRNAEGLRRGQAGRMVFVDLPAGPTVLVYVWEDPAEPHGDVGRLVAELQPIVDSIRFDSTG